MVTPTPFGAYIRACRLAAGKSLREVGEALDVSLGYVSQVESGWRGPFLPSRWPALVACIGADPDELARLAVPEVERLRARVAELEAERHSDVAINVVG